MRAFFVAFVVLFFATSTAFALPVENISVDTKKGSYIFKVEVAADHDSQEKGLMFRKKMAANAGMIFDFHQDVMTTFWMKNTILPLDIIFIRADGTISSIAANAVPMSETPIPCVEPVRAVLELNAGRAAALGIVPGARVRALTFANAR